MLAAPLVWDPCSNGTARSCPSTPGATCSGSARPNFLGEDVQQDPRPGVGRHRQPRRQPVLSRRPGEGAGRPGGAPPPHRRGRPGGPADRRRPSRSACRTASSTARRRCGSPSSAASSSTTSPTSTWRPTASPASSPSWPATSPRSGRSPPCSRTTRRRSSSPTAPSGPASTPRRASRIDLVSAFQVADQDPTRSAHALRAARLPRPGQLRRHVHLQHHADVHRGPRPRAAAHGVARLGRPAPARPSSPTRWSTASSP